jgi:hypothetical protein
MRPTTCSSCYFWSPLSLSSSVGTCRCAGPDSARSRGEAETHEKTPACRHAEWPGGARKVGETSTRQPRGGITTKGGER